MLYLESLGLVCATPFMGPFAPTQRPLHPYIDPDPFGRSNCARRPIPDHHAVGVYCPGPRSSFSPLCRQNHPNDKFRRFLPLSAPCARGRACRQRTALLDAPCVSHGPHAPGSRGLLRALGCLHPPQVARANKGAPHAPGATADPRAPPPRPIYFKRRQSPSRGRDGVSEGARRAPESATLILSPSSKSTCQHSLLSHGQSEALSKSTSQCTFDLGS